MDIIYPTKSVTKVVKNIDSVDVPAYRMKIKFLEKDNYKNITKPIVGPYDVLYKKSKSTN